MLNTLFAALTKETAVKGVVAILQHLDSLEHVCLDAYTGSPQARNEAIDAIIFLLQDMKK